MTTKVAIKGSKDFPQLVIKMLEQAGGKNRYNHIGNDVTGYYYNNFHNEIVCNHPNDVPDEYEKYSFENSIRPILFSTEMVKAILGGRKTQTRREVKPPPSNNEFMIELSDGFGWVKRRIIQLNPLRYEILQNWKCPYGNPGDTLWVRETWGTIGDLPYIPEDVVYAANFCSPKYDKPNSGWKPSIHMPKVACRLFLKVKSVRVERLRDISEEDARAEGVEETKLGFKNYEKSYSVSEFIGGGTEALRSFQSLWKSINGPESWDANPWVWVIEFEVI